MKKVIAIIIVLVALVAAYGCGAAEASIEKEEEVPLSNEALSLTLDESPLEEPSAMHMEILVNLDFGMYGEIAALPYMSALTDAFMEEHEGSSIDFAVVSKDEALELFHSGQTQAVALTGETDGSISVANQCIGIAVHPESPIGDLKRSQIFEIFSGAINNWKDLGLEDAPITLYVTERNSASRQAFEDMLSLRSTGGISKSLIPAEAVVLPDEDSVAEAIAGDKNGIGFIWASKFYKDVILLAVDSTNPNESSIADGSYALSRPIVLLFTEELISLVEFAQSPKMENISRDLGLWPIKK